MTSTLIAEAQLLHRPRFVCIDGFDANVQGVGDGLVAVADGGEAKHIDLPRAEVGGGLRIPVGVLTGGGLPTARAAIAGSR